MSEDIYDDNGEFVETKKTPFSYDGKLESVYLPEPEIWSKPVLDGDAELTALFNSKYPAYYFGHVFDTSNDVFYFGFNDVNDAYTVYLSLNVKGDYFFEKNFSNRFLQYAFWDRYFHFLEDRWR